MPPAEHVRRADAERSITTIVEAAVAELTTDANVSMTQIAKSAGVGRVTLYSHFPSRKELLAAVLDRVVRHAAELLDADQGAARGDDLPADRALEAFVRTSWRTLDQYRRIHTAALAELGAPALRAMHNPITTRIEQLIRRGRREQTFRTDLPIAWMTSTVYALIHAAADDVESGTLAPGRVPALLAPTIIGALSAVPRGPADPPA